MSATAPPPEDGDRTPDPGPPLPELANLEERPSPRLLAHVMEGINRRQTATQFAEVSWWGATGLFMEFVRVLFNALGRGGDREKGT